MKFYKKRISILFIYSLIQLPLTAQEILNNWHSIRNYTPEFHLPSQISDVTVSLPAIKFAYYNSGFAYNDLVTANTTGLTTINVDKILGQLDPENELRLTSEFHTVGITFKLSNKVSLGVGHSIHADNWIRYPKSVFEIFWKGNANYIGKTVELNSSGAGLAYHDFSFQTFAEISKVKVGLRAHYLSGIAAVNAERGNLSLHTSDDVYQLTFNSDILVHTVEPPDEVLKDGVGYQVNVEKLLTKNLISKNSGLAFDLGLSVHVGLGIHVFGGVENLGSIHWKENVTTYASNGTYSYDGFEITGLIEGDSLTGFEGLKDTLKQLLHFSEGPGDFITKLPVRYYVGGRYQLYDYLSLSGFILMEDLHTFTAPRGSIGASWKALPWLEVTGSFGFRKRSLLNPGLGIKCSAGPLKLYVMTDNVLAGLSPGSVREGNVLAGISLGVGK